MSPDHVRRPATRRLLVEARTLYRLTGRGSGRARTVSASSRIASKRTMSSSCSIHEQRTDIQPTRPVTRTPHSAPRRRCQRHQRQSPHWPAAHALDRGSRQRHLPLHQLTRRLRDGRPRRLRHDAVDPQRCRHRRRRLDILRNIIARHTGKSLDEVTNDVGRDRWFDAEQSLEYGFVDHVVDSIDQIVPRPPARQIGPSPARIGASS